MDRGEPKRRMVSQEIDRQHHQILDELNRLIMEILGTSTEAISAQFKDFCALVTAHFGYEEDYLVSVDSDLLAIQRHEHQVLSRMLGNMLGLMEASDQLSWRSTVVDSAVDALVNHFAKEENSFFPLIDRQRAGSKRRAA